MTRGIHYPVLILSLVTGALATLVAMATLLGSGSGLLRERCPLGPPVAAAAPAAGPADCRPD